MVDIKVTIKASNDKKYQITIDPESTVADLKSKIEEKSEIEPARQRLIYSGRVLSKDEEKITTYKVADGHTIHLVQGKVAAPPGSIAASAQQAAVPSIPMASGAGAGNPLAGLTGARYAGQIGLPSTNMFGPDGGMTGFPGEDMSEMLNQPGVREAMDAAFSNPQFVEQMMNSNPQLRNAPPYLREMFRSPEFRNAMLNPDVIRQMSQMQRAMGGGPNQTPFPAPGPASGSNPTSATPTQAPSQLPDLSALMAAIGGGGGGFGTGTGTGTGQQQIVGPEAAGFGGQGNPFASLMQSLGPNPWALMGGEQTQPAAPADNRPPEERYAEQLRQLNDMGFFDFDRNIAALRRTGGSVQGAIETLLNGSV